MVRFLAEIAKRFDTIILPTPSMRFSKKHNIYELDIRDTPKTREERGNSYWTKWGGVYDNFIGTQIELYYGQFLTRANNFENLLDTPNSFYLSVDPEDNFSEFVYINIPKHPWLYRSASVEGEHIQPFLSTSRDADKPSDNILRGVPASVKLELPSLTVKLSENISGMILNQTFNLSFINNDGYFDDEALWNLFNTPVYLKKAVKDNPEYPDFKTMRTGLVEGSATGFGSFSLDVSDRQRAMEKPVCGVIEEGFLGIAIDENTLNKNIPVLYGTKRLELIKLNANTYIACENPTAVTGMMDSNGNPIYRWVIEGGLIRYSYHQPNFNFIIYDKDGNLLAYKVLDPYSGIQLNGVYVQGEYEYPKAERIRFYMSDYTFKQGDNGLITWPEAKTALVTGYTQNKISEAIKDITERRGNIRYNDTNWNIQEFERYDERAYRINFLIEEGTVKTAVQNILKNDMAYLIQQNDGRFTLRRYGTEYATHIIPSWAITVKPEKTWGSAQENYMSSCIINYDFEDKENYKSYSYDKREEEAEDTYRKLVTKTFNTDLSDKADVINLAEMLSERYTTMKQTIKLSVGLDTSDFELMDRVICDNVINGRKFSSGECFIIKELNPAQDILTVEEVDITYLSGEYPHTEDHYYGVDALYADTPEEKIKHIFEGGIQ